MKNIFILVVFIIIEIGNIAYAEELKNIYEIKPKILQEIKVDNANDVRVMQGVYFFDHYAVYAGFQSDDSPIVVTLVDLKSGKILDKNKEKIMGHANDMTCVKKGKLRKFYISDSLSKAQGGTYVYEFEIVDNKIVLNDIPIETGLKTSSITYDNENGIFYSYLSSRFYTFNSVENAYEERSIIRRDIPSYFDNIDDGNVKLFPNALSYSNGNLYLGRTISTQGSPFINHSYVTVYDAKTGEYKYSMHFSSDTYNGHFEGLTVVGDKIYFGLNGRKFDSNGNSRANGKIAFLVYEGVEELEKRYRNGSMGDMDNNGKIDIVDVRLLLQAYINNDVSNEMQLKCDIDDDGEVSILDVRLLLQNYINK